MCIISPPQWFEEADVFTHILQIKLKLREARSPMCNHRMYSVHSCLTLCDPMDCSLPGSSVYGILQVRILEWVAISSFRASSWPRDRTCISCIGRWILYHWTTWETPRILYVPPVHHFLNPQPLAATDPFSFHSFPFSRMSCSWNHTVCNLFRLASFTYFTVFSWFIALLILVLNNITLSICTTVYLSIHLLKNIGIVANLWQLQIRLL